MNQIVIGEIVKVQPQRPETGNIIMYTIEVYLPNGSLIMLEDCQQSSMFGGIGDYYRRRARSREDADFANGLSQINQSNREASVGERVFVGFVNGSLNYPVILGYVQHPNQSDEFVDTSEDGNGTPQSVFSYLGVREVIDSKGQYRLIHQGAPQTKFAPQPSGLAGKALSAVSDGNSALDPADSSNRASFELLSGGIARIKDSAGGMLNFNAPANKVKLSNNNAVTLPNAFPQDILDAVENGDLTVEEVLEVFTSEFIEFDGNLQKIQIHARNILEYTTDGERFDVTKGDSYEFVEGDKFSNIFGNTKNTHGGDLLYFQGGTTTGYYGGDVLLTANATTGFSFLGTVNVSGNAQFTLASSTDITFVSGGAFSIIGNSLEITSLSSLKLKTVGGATLNLSGGVVALGGPAAELLDLFDQTIDEFDGTLTELQLTKVTGNLGFPTSVPINAPAFAAIQANLAAIKALLGAIKGGL